MKFIRRWGLMYSTYPENVQEHSLRVAQIAHALGTALPQGDQDKILRIRHAELCQEWREYPGHVVARRVEGEAQMAIEPRHFAERLWSRRCCLQIPTIHLISYKIVYKLI